PIAASPAAPDFIDASRDIIARDATGNLAMVVLEGGEVVATHFVSAGETVDEHTLFQVASLSKWLTAWGVMTLVEEGRIGLDDPIEAHLERWSLPAGEFDSSGVTVRHLLSHTAGLGDGLGYNGFASRDALQTLEESLSHPADASPGSTGPVRLVREPGRDWAYSGGGYTLLQLLIEDVSGRPFDTFMKDEVFRPLGMQRSTFDLDEARRRGLAENYRQDGTAEPFRYYTALAATSAFTSAADLTAFLKAQLPDARPRSNVLLADETLREMRHPHAAKLGADIWGLGVMLYAPNNQGDFIIGHDGNNEPSINTAVRFDPDTGDGIILLGTGNGLLATHLASEWVFWKTGNVDNLMFAEGIDGMIKTALTGVVILIVCGLLIALVAGRRRAGSTDGHA
ncbi:MAG: serine hydrolase domain-containing protein, partial [Henriciella sp.]|uniref:serine hydrolase domain-containing protein n=1 Tax=Henriciella sp. TaxID=1968823 RepID=UPI003C73C405